MKRNYLHRTGILICMYNLLRSCTGASRLPDSFLQDLNKSTVAAACLNFKQYGVPPLNSPSGSSDSGCMGNLDHLTSKVSKEPLECHTWLQIISSKTFPLVPLVGLISLPNFHVQSRKMKVDLSGGCSKAKQLSEFNSRPSVTMYGKLADPLQDPHKGGCPHIHPGTTSANGVSLQITTGITQVQQLYQH